MKPFIVVLPAVLITTSALAKPGASPDFADYTIGKDLVVAPDARLERKAAKSAAWSESKKFHLLDRRELEIPHHYSHDSKKWRGSEVGAEVEFGLGGGD